jgi:hypothetical protein
MTDGDVRPGKSSVAARESGAKEEVSGELISDWDISEGAE